MATTTAGWNTALFSAHPADDAEDVQSWQPPMQLGTLPSSGLPVLGIFHKILGIWGPTLDLGSLPAILRILDAQKMTNF